MGGLPIQRLALRLQRGEAFGAVASRQQREECLYCT